MTNFRAIDMPGAAKPAAPAAKKAAAKPAAVKPAAPKAEAKPVVEPEAVVEAPASE